MSSNHTCMFLSQTLCSVADHVGCQQYLLGLKDHQGNTALHIAVMEGLPESVQILLQAGADASTPGETTPLSHMPNVLHSRLCN